jgi:hypothetical protein
MSFLTPLEPKKTEDHLAQAEDNGKPHEIGWRKGRDVTETLIGSREARNIKGAMAQLVARNLSMSPSANSLVEVSGSTPDGSIPFCLRNNGDARCFQSVASSRAPSPP